MSAPAYFLAYRRHMDAMLGDLTARRGRYSFDDKLCTVVLPGRAVLSGPVGEDSPALALSYVLSREARRRANAELQGAAR